MPLPDRPRASSALSNHRGNGPVGPKQQIGVYLPQADWLRLRAHAARRGIPITGVFWERLQPLLDELRQSDEIRAVR